MIKLKNATVVVEYEGGPDQICYGTADIASLVRIHIGPLCIDLSRGNAEELFGVLAEYLEQPDSPPDIVNSRQPSEDVGSSVINAAARLRACDLRIAELAVERKDYDDASAAYGKALEQLFSFVDRLPKPADPGNSVSKL